MKNFFFLSKKREENVQFWLLFHETGCVFNDGKTVEGG